VNACNLGFLPLGVTSHVRRGLLPPGRGGEPELVQVIDWAICSRSAWACSVAAVVERVPLRAAARTLGMGKLGADQPALALGEPSPVHRLGAGGELVEHLGWVDLRQRLPVLDAGLEVVPGIGELVGLVGGPGPHRDLAFRGRGRQSR
jgi:hypothetical protein